MKSENCQHFGLVHLQTTTITRVQMLRRLALALCIFVIGAGQSQVFGQKAHKEVLPGSAPFTESFQDMIQRDRQRQIIPGATPELREGPPEQEITGIERTIPPGNEFHAPTGMMPVP